jgi:capsule polysaccharide export protein KpsE/RkpR
MKTYEELRRAFANYVRISSDKKSGLISIEVDDEDAVFAATFANAYADEIMKLMSRLAVSEAQSRRVYFEKQLKDTREHLVAAELGLRKVQESSGVIVLDKQAEALIGGAARLQAQIAEREVALSVMRRSATEKNPDVQRLSAEVAALRGELGRMESTPGGDKPGAFDMPVNKLSEGGIEYVRARRELKLQEALLEGMIRQYEIAKLDEAKEGPVLQQVDMAVPPDRKSKPARSVIVLASTLLALLAMCAWAVWRGYRKLAAETDPEAAQAWTRVGQAWHWRR